MTPRRLTPALLLLAALTAAAVPSFRRVVLKLVAQSPERAPTQGECEAVALANPGDATIWLGYAGFADQADMMRSLADTCPKTVDTSALRRYYGPPARTTALQAHLKATALDPRSVATRFRYALSLLNESGDLNRADEYAPPGQAVASPRTVEQSNNLRAAGAELAACRSLAPDNAACDYLLSWVYFAGRRDAEAVAAARNGALKDHWTTYRREAALAEWHLLDRLERDPLTRIAFTPTGATQADTSLRQVARMLATTGDRYRAQGDHAQAAACYESVLRLGRLMRVNAYSVVEGLLAVALTELAAPSSLVAPTEWEAARAISDGTARVKRQKELRSRALVAYLRAHGRSDLAGFYEQESASAAAWKQSVRSGANRMPEALMNSFFGGGIAFSAALWMQCLLLLVLTLLVDLVVLLTRGWRHRGAGVRPTYRRWLSLLACAVLPSLPVAAALTVSGLPCGVKLSAGATALVVSCLLGLLAWLLGVGVTVGRDRAALPPEQKPGRGATYLVSLWSLTGPTLAALVLLSVLGLGPLVGATKRFETLQRTIAEQGEVRYFGIGEQQRKTPQASPPAPPDPSARLSRTGRTSAFATGATAGEPGGSPHAGGAPDAEAGEVSRPSDAGRRTPRRGGGVPPAADRSQA